MDTYANLFSALIPILRRNLQGINQIAHSISTKGVVFEERWTFDDSSIEICTCLFKFLQKKMARGDGLRIYYDKLLDEPEFTIKMVGYANEGSVVPSLYNKIRKIDEPNAYYDCEMFRKKIPDAVYKLTTEEVDRCLIFKEDKGKYSQCMLIPVCFSDGKMVGLLQIFIEKDSLLVEADETGLKK